MEFLIGIFVGGFLFWLFFDHKRPSGTFVIDFSDARKDICRLELDEHLDDIYGKKSVLLRVRTIAFQSQE